VPEWSNGQVLLFGDAKLKAMKKSCGLVPTQESFSLKKKTLEKKGFANSNPVPRKHFISSYFLIFVIASVA